MLVLTPRWGIEKSCLSLRKRALETRKPTTEPLSSPPLSFFIFLAGETKKYYYLLGTLVVVRVLYYIRF